MSHTASTYQAQCPMTKKSSGMPSMVLFVMFVPGHLFNWAIEWAWLITQLLIAFICLLNTRDTPQKTAGISTVNWIVCFALFTTSGILGTLYSQIFLGLQASVADVPDLIRFAIFPVLAIYIGLAVKESEIDGVTNALKLVLLFNLTTASIILTKIPVLSDLFMLLYEDAKVQYDFGHIRIGIPFQNPNFAALVFILILSYFSFFKQSMLFASLALVSLFITGSRSGFIAAIPILLLTYVRAIIRAVSNPFILALIFSLHVIALSYISSFMGYMGSFARVLELVNSLQAGTITNVETASIRVDVIKNALQFIKLSPFFGIGPGRAYGLDITDSQLIAWPLTYGIPAAIFIIGFFAALFINIARPLLRSNYTASAAVTGIAFFAMLATGDFMKNYRLFFITVLIVHVMALTAKQNSSFK